MEQGGDTLNLFCVSMKMAKPNLASLICNIKKNSPYRLAAKKLTTGKKGE